MSDCVFCRIARGDLPATIEYGDDQVVAVRDVRPQAPVHVLVIPKKHIPRLMDLTPDDAPLVGHIHAVVRDLAAKKGVGAAGFRLVVNNGADAGQTVDHLHFHLLGGRPFFWPPG
jgi:histidine triad (HIT) family protein